MFSKHQSQKLLSTLHLLVFFLSHSSLTLKAQLVDNTIFYNLTEKDGLSSGHVNCILQDNIGFIWIGAENGLNRFDGKAFRVFQNIPDDPTSLPNNRILSIKQDKNHTIWIGTNISLVSFDPKTEKFKELSLPDNVNQSRNNSGHLAGMGAIYSLDIDGEGILWLAAATGFVSFSTQANAFIKQYPSSQTSKKWKLPELLIRAIAQDPLDPNALWLGCDQGLIRFNKKEEKLEWAIPGLPENEQIKNVWDIEFDKNGTIYFCGNNTTVGILNQNGNFEQIKYLPQNNQVNFRSLIPDLSKDKIWLASDNFGFGELNLKTKAFDFFTSTFDEFTSILPGEAGSLMKDYEGRIWIGMKTGLSILDPKNQLFRIKYQNRDLNNSRSILLAAAQMKGDSLLYVSYSGQSGFTMYNRNTWERKNYSINNSKHFTVRDLFFDQKGNLWVSSNLGLFIFDRHGHTFTEPHFLPPTGNYRFNFGQITANNQGHIYINSFKPHGILFINTNNSKSIFFPSNSNKLCGLPKLNQIRDIDVDQSGNLWIAGRPEVVKFDLQDNCFKIIPLKEYTGHAELGAKTIMITSDEKVVFGHGGYGLTIFDPINTSTKSFRVSEGLKSDRIFGLLEDNNSNIWVNTSAGLSSIDLKALKINNYSFIRGMQSGSFREIAMLELLNTNEVFIGGNNYFAIFHPDSIPINNTPPKTVLKSINIFEDENILKKVIGLNKKITLPFKHNTFSISFAALNYTRPEQNVFRYTLEYFDNSWRTTTSAEAFYTNVRPGQYIFKLEAINNDQFKGNLITLKININPPWWASIWAYLGYGVLILSIIIGIYRFQLGRRLAQAEVYRLAELDEVKSRLYTNITHEFRTPLTIITGMAGQLQNQVSQSAKEGLSMILRNGQQLLHLVNQMLDLAKLESGKFQLNMVQGDVVHYLRYVAESFQSYAETKDIRLHFHSEEEAIMMDYDPDNLLNIVSNLLSNAVKFTEKGGDVYFTVGGGQPAPNSVRGWTVDGSPALMIRVRDTGIGIPNEKLPHIFDRFYQGDDSHTRKGEGTGIGLALTRELVKFMEGDLKVKSTLGKGSEFTVLLPARQSAPMIVDMEKQAIKEEVQAFTPPREADKVSIDTTAANTEKPTALLVEDNIDVVKYLLACLEEGYQLEVAYNGQEGIDKALEIVPDIIISDVMMPEKDGFEVCDALKNDERTSHIPLILLTAKADIASKIAGLRRGADAYVPKPFHPEELLVRIENLIEQRKKLQARYQGFMPLPKSSDPSIEMEDAFLQKIKDLVEAHLDEADFDISKLARQAGMSRVQLYRKVKALTGKSPSIFVRTIRLQKAKALLQTTALNISEIAYDVGFSDPASFSKTFREQFGESPTEFRERI